MARPTVTPYASDTTHPIHTIDLPAERQRRALDPKGIEELADTIARDGQLQPIGLRQQEGTGRFDLIFGERRLTAIKSLGRSVIWASIYPSELTDQQAAARDRREPPARRALTGRAAGADRRAPRRDPRGGGGNSGTSRLCSRAQADHGPWPQGADRKAGRADRQGSGARLVKQAELVAAQEEGLTNGS
jgi:hypothetical protein